jgi:FMN phosphatase YigB (HAD superfamily)
MAGRKELKYTKVDLLVAFDLDRTAFDEPYYTEALVELGKEFGISAEAVHAARLETNEQGNSFDELGFMMSKLSEEQRDRFLDTLLARYKKNDFLYPDTLSFLDEVDSLGIPAIALTHGSSWQSVKVAVSPRLHKYPYKIIDSPRKGFLLTESFKDGYYYITPTETGVPAYAARRIFLFDDKQQNFSGISKGAAITAFYLENRSREKKRVPLDVEPIFLEDLLEATEYLQNAAES